MQISTVKIHGRMPLQRNSLLHKFWMALGEPLAYSKFHPTPRRVRMYVIAKELERLHSLTHADGHGYSLGASTSRRAISCWWTLQRRNLDQKIADSLLVWGVCARVFAPKCVLRPSGGSIENVQNRIRHHHIRLMRLQPLCKE